MHPRTRETLAGYYTALLSVGPEELWRGVTVRAHQGRLAGWSGTYVVWRGDGVHVSLPPGCVAAGRLAGREAQELRDLRTWERLAADRGLAVVGPSVHLYRDEPLEPPTSVGDLVRPTADDLARLRGAVDPVDWAESGWPDDPPHAVGVHEGGVLVAAANLNPFAGAPRDVGVLVGPATRGRGLAAVVAGAAAAHAVEHHGFARWGARETNTASLATARRLGFTPWCGQLAVR